jgi:hypothetical protein
MGQDIRPKRLLWDALSRVLANPTANPTWRALLAAYEVFADPELPDAVARAAPREGVAGFLRATFLAGLPGGEGHIAEAGRLVREIQPIDIDRLMAFATFEWGRAVASVADRAGFVTRLRDASLPEVMALAGDELLRQASPLTPRDVQEVRKVAVVAPYFGKGNHPPTVLALRQAGLLQSAGLEVMAFAAQEPLMAWMPDYLGNQGRVSVEAPSLEQLSELAELSAPGLAIGLADPDFSLAQRWRQVLAGIAQFDPDLVLFVGLFSPLVAPLHRARPVLGLNIHAVASMAPVDAWLASDPVLADRETSPWGAALPPAGGVHHPYRVSLKPTGAPIVRAQIEATDEDLVMVTVGARLGEEIGGEWAERMIALLRARQDLVWVLVGGTGACPPALREAPLERLRFVPHQADLRSVLRCCDLYLNPPRMGGGFSVAEAMAEGLAVVSLGDSDGGDKLGEEADASLDGYFARLNDLLASREACVAQGARLRERFSQSLDLDRSGPSLRAACDVALDHYRRRT